MLVTAIALLRSNRPRDSQLSESHTTKPIKFPAIFVNDHRSRYRDCSGFRQNSTQSPNANLSVPSSQGANQCVAGATQCDEEAEPTTLSLSKNALDSAARCDVVQSSTMLCCPFAPLAQLAEQLTLNQGEPSKNDGNSAVSQKRAALGAAVGAENQPRTGAVDSSADDGLRFISDAWPHLSAADRSAIVAAVRSALNHPPTSE